MRVLSSLTHTHRWLSRGVDFLLSYVYTTHHTTLATPSPSSVLCMYHMRWQLQADATTGPEGTRGRGFHLRRRVGVNSMSPSTARGRKNSDQEVSVVRWYGFEYATLRLLFERNGCVWGNFFLTLGPTKHSSRFLVVVFFSARGHGQHDRYDRRFQRWSYVFRVYYRREVCVGDVCCCGVRGVYVHNWNARAATTAYLLSTRT